MTIAPAAADAAPVAPPITPETTAAVDAAITSRRSVRAFLPTSVSRATVERILEVASRAPSGTNTQPWKVHVLTGAAKERLSRAILAAYNDPQERLLHTEEYAYYAREWISPYIERRRKVGWDMYGLLGIGRGDKERMHAQHGRNFVFFDAPVGLIFTIHRAMGVGSLLDYGMFMQNIMVAARARGLHTCPQAAWNHYGSIILPHVGAGADEKLVCGMALGWPDAAAPVNGFETPREGVEGFTRWLD